MSLSDRLRRLEQQQEEQRLATARVEEKLDALLGALADEGEEEQDQPAKDLDGSFIPGERDQSQSLG